MVYSTFRWTATGSPRCGISSLKVGLDRVEAELEGVVLAPVGLPRDPELLALGLGGRFPAVPEGLLELVDRELLAVLEEVPVVERDRVVDLPAEEHRSGGRRLLSEHVAPAPVLRAEDEAVVARVREVLKRLAVVAWRQPPRDLDASRELRRARRGGGGLRARRRDLDRARRPAAGPRSPKSTVTTSPCPFVAGLAGSAAGGSLAGWAAWSATSPWPIPFSGSPWARISPRSRRTASVLIRVW